MIFADLPLAEAEGAVLAHGVKAGQCNFKKGRVLSAADVAALAASGRAVVTVAKPEPGDIGEDEAATRVAEAARGANVRLAPAFTGRCNLFAAAPGVLTVDRDRLDLLNSVDESITLATLAPFELVSPGEMVATVKIIPFAVPAALVERCVAVAGRVVRVAALRPRAVALIQTRLPGLKESVLDKTARSINERLAALGCGPAQELRCDHDVGAVAGAIESLDAELVLVSGASAITDRRDVIPAALVRVGGRVDHLGMPVDPGNLLMLGRRGEVPVLGLPGCARSPKLNGFDWVLQRLMADLPVTGRDIMSMGAGGLLKEIASRPQPREGAPTAAASPRAPRVAALVLAAGRSSRMGAANKLLAELDGAALVTRAVDAALSSHARPVVVVTGHEAERVRAALGRRTVGVVHNPDYADGLSASLRRGLTALPHDLDGALVCLADMPLVSAAALDRLIHAFNPAEGRAICVPTWKGKRGNPVLWARRFFAEMARLTGDVGARHLIGEHAELVAEVPMPDDSVLADIDTPDELAALRSGRIAES